MPDNHCGRLLVVEDDAELRFILVAHLRAAGFEVLEASDGSAGVKRAQESLPDVILMDVGLPVMDGITATRTLKADPRTAAIPIVMLTARSGTQDVVRGLEAGVQEYLSKPFDVAELLARVRTVHRLATTHQDLDRLNNRLEQEVEIKTRRLQFLYEYMRDLNRVDTRDGVLDLIMHCVEHVTGAKRLSLLMVDATGENLLCARARGIAPSVAEKIRIRAMEGIAGQVFQSGKTYAARAVGLSADGNRVYKSETFLSTPLISTSLATRDGVIGVLNVTEKLDDTSFTDEEIACIRSIADAGAIALDNITRRLQLEQSVRVLLQTVGHLAEYRDEETTLHLGRVARMSRILAEELRRGSLYAELITEDYIENLVLAAPLHDIGKVGIPDEILTKPGKLTDEEFQIMKSHTEIGRRVLSQALDPTHPVPLLRLCIDIAHCHHERFDGRGYPRRIAGEDIPLAARIVALVDAYDAITSHRRYSKARSHEQAVQVVTEESGKHFDPVLVDAFLRCHAQFAAVRARFDDAESAPQPLPSEQLRT